MITLYWYTNQTAAALEAISERLEIVELQQSTVVAKSRAVVSPPVLIESDTAAALIYKRKVSLDVDVDDSSYRYRALMQKVQLVLKFSLPEYIDFPVGTWCVFQNQKFTLNSEKNLTKNGKRNITYSMTLGGDEDNLALYKLRNSVDGRLKYSMCAQPSEFIEEIVKNLNDREGSNVWSVGTCIESTEKTVEFNHVYIDDALQTIADTFETEWEIVDHVISLHKVEYFKDDPLPLAYGKGNGFVPGLGRTTDTDEAPIKRIYTQGGTQNINRSKYGGEGSDFEEYETTSSELRLPPNQTLEYEGRTYKTDSQGYYVERSDKVSTAVKEDSLDCSEIYPSRVGTVSSVETINADKHFYDFLDTSIPDDLNFNDYFISGETPTIIFQSGMLAGKEFEFTYKHSERRFELVPQEIDGITMPDPTTGYMPVEGNEYAVFGIMLPKAYFFDNETQTGASWDMFREAAKKLYENEDQKFTFKGDLQGLWAKNNWLRVGGYLVVGGYILFTDDQFAQDGLAIRITGIKDYVNSPYAPTLEISNSVSGSSLHSDLAAINNTEVVINDAKQEFLQFTKRRFRDAQETIKMLEDAMIGDFTSSISPIAVTTMAMLVGDESLQFDFVESKDNQVVSSSAPSYSQKNKQLIIPRLGLLHYTLGSKTMSATSKSTMCWQMPEWNSPVLGESERDSRYYLYAIVSSTDTEEVGEYTLSTKALGLNDTTGKYNLLVGILNSEEDDERSFVTLHGFTEILPGRITTDVIVSTDGNTYFDLVHGVIAGTIKFRNTSGELQDVESAIDDGINSFGETIIDGGYIKTDLIKTSDIVANHVSVENDNEDDNRKITISPDTMSMDVYDDSGEICTTFEGKSYDSLDGIFGDSAGSVSVIARTIEQYGFAKNVSLGRGQATTLKSATDNQSLTFSPSAFPITDAWQTDTPTEVIMSQGYLYLKAYSIKSTTTNTDSTKPVSPMTMSMANGYIHVCVATYEDEACTTLIERKTLVYLAASSSADTLIDSVNSYTDTKTLDIGTKKPSTKTSAGWHRIELLLYQNVSGKAGNYVELAWGNYNGANNDLGAITYKSDFYVSRFFANGFCLGERNDNYVVALKTANGMQFAAQNGNYGIKCSEAGVQMYNGSKWLPVPMVMLHARCSYSSSSTSYSWNSYTVYDGVMPTLSRVSQGRVRIFFPTSWGSFSYSKYMVNVVGASPIDSGTNPNKAQIYAMTSTYIDVTISDDASTNDGDFLIDIWKLG